ncbi:hypothetical protein CA833_00295 [Novosphingobium sp. KA1]|nr:hypothetical protein CA833_00295 [Novosphingobium sp. KA1]
MLADVTVDGRPESQFRLAIESMLRAGDADQAARALKAELGYLCGEGQPLPARFRFIAASELEVTGWDRLIERIGELDSPGDPITAIGIDVCGMQAGFGGAPTLAFETTYYTDQAWGFSHADRDGLCAGYTGTTNAWQGAFEDLDDTLRVAGLDDLNAVIAALENHCRSGSATPEEQRGFVVGACYLAVLVHQAVRDKVTAEGLPRAMAVLVGSNEAYPWFEAPAASARDGFVSAEPAPAARGIGAVLERRPLDLGAHLAAMPAPPSHLPSLDLPSSDLTPSDLQPTELPAPIFDTGRAPFAPPLAQDEASTETAPPLFDAPGQPSSADELPGSVFRQFPQAQERIDFGAADFEAAGFDDWPAETQHHDLESEETAELAATDAATDYAALDGLRMAATATPATAPLPVLEPAREAMPVQEDEEALHLPPPGIHVTGTQLRRRFVDRETIAIEEERPASLVSSLLERLFGKK